MGLTGAYIFTGTNGNTGQEVSYIGKGPEARNAASEKDKLKGNTPTQSAHADFSNHPMVKDPNVKVTADEMGLMVEAQLMHDYDAKVSGEFANKIESPGKKKLAALNTNSELYKEIQKEAK